MLAKWNRVYNLTRVPPEQTVSHHLLDSLAIVPIVGKPDSLIDVGSGGGLPGIPLALYLPDTRVTLLDSNGKKTRFLEQARIERGLENVTVVHARVEDYTGQFDVVTSRAFASLADFCRLTAHLLTPHGVALAMKGPNTEVSEDAASEADLLPLALDKVIELNVPGIAAERRVCQLHLAGEKN